jgi:hypothetical protein
MRADANKIAFRAIRNIMEGAKPFEVEVAGTKVTCAVSHGVAPPWPERGVQGLEQEAEGPWPAPVDVECRWEGGHCNLLVQCDYWRTHDRYRHHTGLHVRLRDRAQSLVWITLPPIIGDLEDGTSAKIQASVSTFKRKKDFDPELGNRLNAAMRELLHESGLPLVAGSTAEVCAIEVPSGAVVSGADLAFRRLVQLALLKIEFVDRGSKAKERGRAIVDLRRCGIELEKIATTDQDDGEEESNEDDDDDITRVAGRRYWAGGFGEPERLAEFKTGGFWQIGWAHDSTKPAAVNTWKRFASVQPGDYFAIKGYGGSHDLVVHFVGEVTSVDAEKGRVALRRLDVPLFKGEAPRGRGAGGWFDTLVPVVRPDVIEELFGVAQVPDTRGLGAPVSPIDLPANLILYGPPGTGKTYTLQTRYLPRFAAQPRAAERDLSSVVADLKWYQVIALALHALGSRARVAGLLGHPALKAKYAAQAIPTPLRQVVWTTLGQHAVERSQTVKTKRRFGELLFDKHEDGTWTLEGPLPEELTEAAAELTRPAGAVGTEHHSFVTFHQAYGYEDFIEGIRPRIRSAGDEDDATLTYDLVDGVFKRAVKSALRLAGFDGTLDDFCLLQPDERRRHLEHAPRYAVFIDEINRGNVARILGELITLLETDKRLGAENELIVTLPYSGTRFGVPSNLHVIGTMNTADRSVEALDAALRRRFEFEELPPLPELLDFTIEGDIDPAALLRTINRRLEVLRDRDHVIGHAYLLDLKDDPTLEALKHVFKSRILPLLQEYFFGDWGKIGLVLGRSFVRKRELSTVQLADFDHAERDTLSERMSWELVDVKELTNLAFRSVYERVDNR